MIGCVLSAALEKRDLKRFKKEVRVSPAEEAGVLPVELYGNKRRNNLRPHIKSNNHKKEAL